MTSQSQPMTGVIFLLIALVIVPTICLVWFMGAALKHGELALREELGQLYRDRFKALMPIENTVPLTLKRGAIGCVTYDKNGYCVYPLLMMDFPSMSRTPLFDTALALEQEDRDWQQALDLYRTATQVSSIPDVVYDGTVGQIRCLRAMSRYDEAMALCETLAFSTDPSASLFTSNQRAKACLLLVELGVDVNRTDVFSRCLWAVMDSNQVATETQAFVLHRMVDQIQSAMHMVEGFKGNIHEALAKMEWGDIQAALAKMEWDELSVCAADRFPDVRRFQAWDNGTLQACELDGRTVYGLGQKTGDTLTVSWVSDTFINDQVTARLSSLKDDKVFCRLEDRDGRVVGQDTEGVTFFTEPLHGILEGWTVSLAFHPSIFPELATRQRQMYLWTLVLVVGLTVVLGLVTATLLRREMRLNRLKNDFMATVTHELKTPLASTRLLVETLLERECSDPVQVQQYLALINRENKRLGTLIDNFLTFSRMERNRQVLDKQCIPVETCVQAACEAIQVRMQDTGCDFECHVDRDLPEICVDQAAFVTVLVNLLDNALKYTGDNKVVRLDVTREQDGVCFKVRDNGIGMTPRQAKKAFERFYQADTSLTRDTHGCGLGLAIVKYIVEAHGGTAHVDSTLGKGSEFAVRLPVSF